MTLKAKIKQTTKPQLPHEPTPILLIAELLKLFVSYFNKFVDEKDVIVEKNNQATYLKKHVHPANQFLNKLLAHNVENVSHPDFVVSQ